MTQPTVGSFLFDYLAGKGVGHVFGLPGDDCSPSLRRMGEELGKLRNKEKRG